MDIVLGIVVLLMISAMFGERGKGIGVRNWTGLALIALAQVVLTLYYAFTKNLPPSL